jgi:single-strand DNA-binding protein
MSPVEVRQIGHVASAPVVETFSSGGRTENKALVTVISNTRWKDREGKVHSKATAILWALWGKAAINASWYLDVGSKVAVSGTVESRHYSNKEGKQVWTFSFTARSVEYLESRTEAEARRKRRAELKGEGATTPARKQRSTSADSAAQKKEG